MKNGRMFMASTNHIKFAALQEALKIKRVNDADTRNRLVIVVVVAAAIATGIGTTDALFTTGAYHNTVTSKQCVQTPLKMFDGSNVPKYFIGPGYKITSIDPKATDVNVTICK